MERRLSLLFGIIGGLFLVFLKNLSMELGTIMGYVTDFLFTILALIGIIFIIYFSFLLIIDTLKTIHKK
ncbi:hypothetical protein G9F71_000925 [Clostridium sp. FP2]|uniref:hypothetical protein n=1 Tax=Clostridium sp. FP2 TaxID=2724481 RepID=UPI0013E94AB9|nr:hypothetical protein [Clostridium sp. FP2]MBZ9621455.1 hypothetical protein [Clostridium sp. FP2]